MSNTKPALVSVGYEGRSIHEFVDVLASRNVDLLVDVRLNAISRKKGFSKTALANALNEQGIEYRHERELGNPKDNREPFRQGLPEARVRYNEHLSNGVAATCQKVIELARERRVALMCYELAHEECHRSSIFDQAQKMFPKMEIMKL